MQEDFEERAGILEHCGGLTKGEAEEEAMKIVLEKNDS